MQTVRGLIDFCIKNITNDYFPRHWQNSDDHNNWQGPLHNGGMSIKDVTINSDMTCYNGWICEHRSRQTYNMVAFRNVVGGTPLQNWHAFGDYQIAFSRGNKGFIAIVGDGSHLNANAQTGLPSGTYCVVISEIMKTALAPETKST
ncbi:AMY-like protein [Mya arenaria]|uniref:AMY-like protein n=1 Tax=Mya arenaria TaxID=6604 RepID=A0ABY7EYQ4_MYAAR|nr:AMY-like protein [Mya arenaria]